MHQNPFVVSGYVSPRYFCDRPVETRQLIENVINGNHVALVSARRMGKTGLIRHCFHQSDLSQGYYCFFVDIYPSKSLRDFVFMLSKEIIGALKPRGRKALDGFWTVMKSIQGGINFDPSGNPSFNLQLGDIRYPEATLDELFFYLERADRPCVVAIDEFQQIASYDEDNVEALLRTHVQQCPNASFIFAGSQRHVMGNMFTSPARPFYQSVAMMHLDAIPEDVYVDFACRIFAESQKRIEADAVRHCYGQFSGITWYVQKILNVLYSMTGMGETAHLGMVSEALDRIVDSYDYAYSELLFRLPARQRDLLVALSKADAVGQITSSDFLKESGLPSASSVQSAMKGLLEKDYVTCEGGRYSLYDKFLRLWLKRNY